MEAENQLDNKNTPNKLLIGGIFFAAVVLLGLLFMKSPKHKYRITTSQMLEESIAYRDAIAPTKLCNILFANDSMYQFIDLRSPSEFIQGHLPNAINIPAHKVLSQESEKILNQDKKINILYHATHMDACGVWMLLKQLGYKNNKILLGGYDFVKANILDNFSPLSGNSKNEQAKYDYANILKQTNGSAIPSTTNESSKDQKINQSNTKTKSKKSSGGGC